MLPIWLMGAFRFTLRTLRNRPAYSVVAVATLALGIAAATTVFGWIDTVLLRPVPGAAAPHQLAALEGVAPDGGRLVSCPHPDFRDFQREMTLASGVVGTRLTFFTIGPIDRPRRVLGQIVSANFFDVLGVKPFLGRMLRSEEDRDNRGAYPIAVISHRLWKGYFGSDPGVVGRAVRINGRLLTVVGVAPPEFRGTIGGAALDVWAPLSMILEMGSLNTWAAADRNARFLDIIVRLKPGATLEQARSEAQAIAARIAAAYPDTHKGIGASLAPMSQASYGLQATLGQPLRILMAVCALVLLIACANVANLLMARSVSRQREFGVRMALGATRWKLAAHVISEALALAGTGGAAGVLLALWLASSLSRTLPALDPPVRAALEPLLQVELNATVLAFAVLASLFAAVLSALMPALAAGRADVNEILKEEGRSGTPGARTDRARSALVIAEVALASVAIIGAGLAVRSFQKLAAVDPGFDPRRIMVAHFHLSTNGYSLEREKQFSHNLRLRLEASPGIEQAAYADSAPLSLFPPPGERVDVEGSSEREGVTSVSRSVVSPGYFRLMGIPLLAGRDFTEQDDRNSPRVIIVNQTFARRYFGDQDPLGRRVRVSDVWSTIVGVAKDGKYRNPPEAPTAFFYGPFRQIFWSGHNNFMYIRTSGDPEAARVALRREAAALDASSGLYEVAALTEHMQAGLFAERIAACLLSVLGILSLALAALGLYSVMAYAVSERTHEIGIRMALGAQPREVLGMVLMKGLRLTFGGFAAGVAVVFAAVRIAASRVELPMSMAEPAVFAAAGTVLVLVALLASWAPARRATAVDPSIALRSE